MTDNLGKMVDAAQDGNWRAAVAAAGLQVQPLRLSALLSAPDLSVGVAWSAAQGPHTLCVELRRIFASEIEPECVDTAVPALIAQLLFEQTLECFRSAVRDRRNPQAIASMAALLAMPGASDARELDLRAVLTDFLRLLANEQRASLARARLRGASGGYGMLAPELYTAVVQADQYPDLSLDFLRQFLRMADVPALRPWSEEHVLVAWPDLMTIVTTRPMRAQITDCALDWLQRVTSLDPEEFAPGEFLEDEP